MTDPDRLPPIPESEMTPEQRAVMDEIASGPRGSVPAPFAAMLRSPEMTGILQRLGAYLRFGSRLPANVKEVAILTVAREWGQRYEWAYHLPMALQCGVARETCEAIAAGRRPETMTAEEAAAYDLVAELNATRSVSDGAYARALEAFGEAGVVDLCGFCGHYALLAMVMNTARTPAPEAEIPLE